MMAKFDSVNTEKANTGADAGKVANDIAKSRDYSRKHTPASIPEQERRKREMKTQGKPGCKMERLNLAVTPENKQAVRILASVTGKSMIEVFNDMITEYRKNHKDLFDDAEKILERYGG